MAANTAPAQRAAPPLAVRTSTDGDVAVAKPAEDITGAKGTYTVAPGRTVDGKAPGETVELDAADADRLLKLGFILDRDGSIVVQTEGPKVISGGEIQER